MMLVIGLAVGFTLGSTLGWPYGVLGGWGAAALSYIVVVWRIVWPLDAEGTRKRALREDPSRRVFELVIIVASLASIAIIVMLLIGADVAHSANRIAIPVTGLVVIFLSWLLVQTLFTLRYARLYYGGDEGGVSFNDDSERPTYRDFAYLAFTLGMTYQVSDTNIRAADIRLTALKQGLLSYLFGAVILASTVNVVAGLAH